MSTITTINGSDKIKDSRSVINANFANLNADKAETLTDLGVTSSAGAIDNAVTNSPTANEKAAMSGGGYLGTPSAANKFLTEDSVTISTFLLASSGANAEIADNTAVETNIASVNIPANTLGTSGAVRLRIYVDDFTNISGFNGATFRLKYGTTTLASLVVTAASSTIRLYGYIDGIIIANGSTLAQRGILDLDLGNQLDPDAVTQTMIRRVAHGTATENSTLDRNIQVTIQWTNAGASQNFTPCGFIVERI